MKPLNGLVSIGLFIIFSCYLTAQSGTTGAVKGSIKDANTGMVVSQAKITFVLASNETLKYELYSNKKGRFYKGGLTPGTYKVHIEMEGYLPTSFTMRVQLAIAVEADVELTSFESTVPESEKLTKRGLKLLNTGKYDEAIETFAEGISSDQSNPVFYYYRGFSLEKNGNIDEALEDYEKAIELKPDFILPYSRSAIIYAKRKNYENASEFYKKSLELGNQDATTHYNYGVVLLNLRKSAEAKAVLERLLSLDENYSAAYYQLGIIHISSGDAAKAKEFLQKFIDIDPENMNAPIAKKILESLN